MRTRSLEKSDVMTTFLLVPGAWLGGWAWQDVTRPLMAAGHHAYPITLTGLGERVHLGRAEVTLSTHVRDIMNVLLFEDLRDVVIVGHSYGAVPVTGAAAMLPERIRRVVYLDSGPFPVGAVFLDAQEEAAAAEMRRVVEDQGGWQLPMPSWEELQQDGASIEGLDDAMLARFRRGSTAHPFGTYTTPLDAAPEASMPKTLISCSFPLATVRELIAAGHPWFAALGGPEWDLRELPTGHWPMFSKPDELAAMLAEIGEA